MGRGGKGSRKREGRGRRGNGKKKKGRTPNV